MKQEVYFKSMFSIVIFSILKTGIIFSLFNLNNGKALLSFMFTKEMGTIGIFFLRPILLYDRRPLHTMLDELFKALNDTQSDKYINKILDDNIPIEDEL